MVINGGGKALRTGRWRRNRRREAPHRRPTRRSARPRAPPSRPAPPARTWGGEARASGPYSYLHVPTVHLHTHLARRSRPSIAPALAPARARSAHRLPHARCYPGPAGASAGGDHSARGLRKAAAQRLREGGHAQKVPSRAAEPRPSGTRAYSVTGRDHRAHELA